jgi:ABC-type sugar transport system substrate-binding protein
VLVLSYLSDPIAPLQVAALDKAAPLLGVTLLVRDIRSSADIAAAFDAGVSEHVDGLIMTAESVLLVFTALKLATSPRGLDYRRFILTHFKPRLAA